MLTLGFAAIRQISAILRGVGMQSLSGWRLSLAGQPALPRFPTPPTCCPPAPQYPTSALPPAHPMCAAGTLGQPRVHHLAGALLHLWSAPLHRRSHGSKPGDPSRRTQGCRWPHGPGRRRRNSGGAGCACGAAALLHASLRYRAGPADSRDSRPGEQRAALLSAICAVLHALLPPSCIVVLYMCCGGPATERYAGSPAHHCQAKHTALAQPARSQPPAGHLIGAHDCRNRFQSDKLATLPLIHRCWRRCCWLWRPLRSLDHCPTAWPGAGEVRYAAQAAASGCDTCGAVAGLDAMHRPAVSSHLLHNHDSGRAISLPRHLTLPQTMPPTCC